MKRFTSLLHRTKSSDNASNHDFSNAPADSPEANAARAIRLFCESGSASNGGEEVLHLPVIVEAAESSPSAAAASAQQIRKFLTRDWSQKPYVQYNAIMLIRILSDNPGPTFTRNFDKQFVGTVKELLRNCRDDSTQTILRETLDNFEVNKNLDVGMQGVLQMWRKEKGGQASLSPAPGRRVPGVREGQQLQNGYAQYPPQQEQQYQNVYGGGYQQPQGHRSAGRHQLPPPIELASRVEEARNTAKILMQLIQSTPAEETLNNELLKEFNERCQSAQRSMQGYINCNDPAPDHDTMQTLIETNEQLSLAGSRYQRAILAGRRALGGGTPSPNPEAVQDGNTLFANKPVPALPPVNQSSGGLFAQQPQTNGRESYQAPRGPPPSQYPPTKPVASGVSNPFADPVEHDANPAPLAIEPTNYGSSQLPSHRQQPSQAFNIDSGPTYSSNPRDRRNTVDLENAYSPVSNPSPTMTRSNPGAYPTHSTASSEDGYTVSPNQSPRLQQQQQRPGPGPYHNSAISPSYIGRQASALNGLTMHGAQAEDDVPEIDGHSEVGRKDIDTTSPTSIGTQSSGAGNSLGLSPSQARRVDIAGTGGFRNSMIKAGKY